MHDYSMDYEAVETIANRLEEAATLLLDETENAPEIPEGDLGSETLRQQLAFIQANMENMASLFVGLCAGARDARQRVEKADLCESYELGKMGFINDFINDKVNTISDPVYVFLPKKEKEINREYLPQH
ncbi:MAG: hypothetical protein LBR58_11460 [Propionibacteriaceae bacterium]|jgi:hypothetical protein|nr:hypothetical protein [Propionibacteriaceae bacterium]